MENTGNTANTAKPAEEIDGDEINLLDLLLVLARHRNLIIGMSFGAALLAVAIVLNISHLFTATAYVVPVQTNQSAGAAAAILGQLNLGGIAGNVGGGNNGPLFVRILESRRVAEQVVKKFELDELYETSKRGETLDAFRDRLSVEADNKSGIIGISIDDTHPTRAADMANFMVDQLLSVTRELALTEASRRRVFFEKQLGQARGALHEAESELKAFQAQSGIVSLEEQGRGTLNMIARLQAEITAREIQIRVLRQSATDENPIIQQQLEQLRAMRAELARMQSMDDKASIDGLGRLSAGGLDYAKRYREVRYREAVMEILGKQYEIARLDEARDSPVIQVLDYAVTPEIPSKPKRKLIVIGAALGGGMLAVLLAFIIEGLNSARRDPESNRKLAEFRGMLLRPPFSRGKVTGRPASGD